MESIIQKCIGNNQAILICTTLDCQQNTFMCSDSNCKCYSLHQSCTSRDNLKQIIEKLYVKGRGTQKSIIKYANIIRMYENFITKILIDTAQMKDKNSLLGLEQHQYQFDQIVKGVKKGSVTGDLAFSVVESLKNFPNSIFELIAGEQQYMKKIESQFNQSLLSLRTLWKFRVQHTYPNSVNQQIQKFKQNERALKEFIANKTYWLQINGKQEQNSSNIADLKEVTGIGFSECNLNILKLLGTHCKNLKNLGVRPDTYQFGDQQAQQIATNLKNLTRLTLHNHNIGDVGASKIAQNLKALQVLVIYGNKLTSEGQEHISGVLPRCTTLLTGEPS